MCGIIGITSNKPVSSTIINSLRKLEYRGYDSAGIAVMGNDGIQILKKSGKVSKLDEIIDFSFSKNRKWNFRFIYRTLISNDFII